MPNFALLRVTTFYCLYQLLNNSLFHSFSKIKRWCARFFQLALLILTCLFVDGWGADSEKPEKSTTVGQVMDSLGVIGGWTFVFISVYSWLLVFFLSCLPAMFRLRCCPILFLLSFSACSASLRFYPSSSRIISAIWLASVSISAWSTPSSIMRASGSVPE